MDDVLTRSGFLFRHLAAWSEHARFFINAHFLTNMDVEAKLRTAGALVLVILAYAIIKQATVTNDDKTYMQINNLHLATDASYTPATQQTEPAIRLKFIESPRTFRVISLQLKCINPRTITNHFKKGTVASITIEASDYKIFRDAQWYDYESWLYGLSKDRVQFLPSSCRHRLKVEASNQLMITCLTTGLVIIGFIAYISLNKNGAARLERIPLGLLLAAVFFITLFSTGFFS
ncbi:hypothetical protein LQ567_08290 [Niabella pedocola]|uniref:Uncharacterized protein n=1 Tax=Niabella pedocola TaxID=1752077 RepID=A0ABS8PNU2_9BACT|nr:hypothetical protein [Niabella pedocola]MCD2422756.1 hypothetical protein [Niabella pedocola]